MSFWKKYRHINAVLIALFVTFLWSTSFIIIKKALVEIEPVTFAGLRYVLAAIFIIPLVARKYSRMDFGNITKENWIQLILLGLVFYTFTQGIQFIGLYLLPPVTVSLMLNFTPIVVVVIGFAYMNERPTMRQLSGVFVFLCGVILYFFPAAFEQSQWIGISVMAVGVVCNALSSVLGRKVNKSSGLDPLLITFISMSAGSVLLLGTGIAVEGIPSIPLGTFGLLIWLALVNTAYAFTLWNYALRTLSAMESSVINGTMLIQIAVLAWLFLDDPLTSKEIAGMILAAIGAILVQLRNIRVIRTVRQQG